MNDELYTFALRNTLSEIKNTCPDVSHTFIFTDDGQLVAQDEDTDEAEEEDEDSSEIESDEAE